MCAVSASSASICMLSDFYSVVVMSVVSLSNTKINDYYRAEFHPALDLMYNHRSNNIKFMIVLLFAGCIGTYSTSHNHSCSYYGEATQHH